jgi:hypothetical protein
MKKKGKDDSQRNSAVCEVVNWLRTQYNVGWTFVLDIPLRYLGISRSAGRLSRVRHCRRISDTVEEHRCVSYPQDTALAWSVRDLARLLQRGTTVVLTTRPCACTLALYEAKLLFDGEQYDSSCYGSAIQEHRKFVVSVFWKGYGMVIVHEPNKRGALELRGATVLLQKPILSQLDNIFPAFYGSRKFITVFTRARHRFLS